MVSCQMSLLLKYGMNITFSTSARRSFYIKSMSMIYIFVKGLCKKLP